MNIHTKETHMSKSWAKGSTTAWRKLRATVLTRDKGTCQIRLPNICTKRATCVHHTHGRATTGDDPTYLQAACQPCNLKLGDPRKHKDPPGKAATQW